MRVLLLVASFAAVSLHVQAEDGARIDPAKLGDPARRIEAFQQYRIQVEPNDAEKWGWRELEPFLEWHDKLRVVPLGSPSKPRGYLVTWESLRDADDWRASTDQSDTFEDLLQNGESVHYQVFSADGVPLRPEDGYISDGAVADLDGDGEPEEIERVLSFRASSKTTSTPESAAEADAEIFISYLLVRRSGEKSGPPFALLYNCHPRELAAAGAWDFQLRRRTDADAYQIELGPPTLEGRVEPKVIFRWDLNERKWVGPASNPGDHFHILGSDDVLAALDEVADMGGLGYGPIPAERHPSGLGSFSTSIDPTDGISVEALSKPYRYASLAGLSNEALLEFMARRRTIWDYTAERVQEISRVPDFWKIPPRDAALSYVKRNRHPNTFAYHKLGLVEPEGLAAPDEGSLTLSDGPSGCFAPFGHFVHHLHCARDGSYLMYLEDVYYGRQMESGERRPYFDVRRLELPYETARHLLQTGWWLSRVRTREVTGKGGSDFMNGGSTSDGVATVLIDAGPAGVRIKATRTAADRGRFQGSGAMSGGYDASAYISLVVQLFAREVPARLGSAWTGQRLPLRWDRQRSLPRAQTPPELARAKAIYADVLRQAVDGKLPSAVVLPAEIAAGEMGWSDLRGHLEAIRDQLAEQLPHETRVAELDAELGDWKMLLGEAGSDEARRSRDRMTSSADVRVIPGLEPTLPDASPPDNSFDAPAPPEEDGCLAFFDALHANRDRLVYHAPVWERETVYLREAAVTALRQLALYHDAEGLAQWAAEDIYAESFVVARLRELDRPRLIKLVADLLNQKSRNEDPQLLSIMRPLAPRSPDGLTPGERAEMLSILLNPTAEYWDRKMALEALVPPAEPLRYADPEIDSALLNLLTPDSKAGEFCPGDVPLSAARRLGASVWDHLHKYATTSGNLGLPNLRKAISAMILVAQKEGEPFRSRMSKLLAPELRETKGFLNDTFRAFWQLNLREMKGELERIATSGPSDYEGNSGSGGSNHRDQVQHRYHLARQIVALWNEKDPLTRTKMQVALAAANCAELQNTDDGALEAARTQLAAMYRELSQEQRKELIAFMDWCTENALGLFAEWNLEPEQHEFSEAMKSLRDALN
jgi:hypothetical protein